MITVKEADLIIRNNILQFSVTECNVIDSYGEILREDLFSDMAQPPFHRVAMDGIAIDIISWEKGQRTFIINGIQKAGSEALILGNSELCIEVMTGSVLPINSNCVIRVEDIEITSKGDVKEATINSELSLRLMQNVHQKASDYRKDDLVLKSGSALFTPQIGLAISVGKSKVLVSQKPKIAIISTGDELVDIGQEVKPYQIRMSNSYAIYSLLKQLNYKDISIFHIIDCKELLLGKLNEILSEFDVLILSGGVSMGKFDYIPEVLKELNVEELFHKISQKPGKPIWFGKRQDNKIIFGLPGNPVSSIVCFYRYVIPFLQSSSGQDKDNFLGVKLDFDVKVKPGLTSFIPVKLNTNEKLENVVSHIETNGSGDFASLANTDGFIELNNDYSEKGNSVPFYNWKI